MPKGVDGMVSASPARICAASSASSTAWCSVSAGCLIKNMTLLLSAFARVAQSDPSAHLVLVGEGPEQASLAALAERHGVSKRVTFVGYVPQDQLGPYYRTADLFVLSSDFDNSPNVVLEAMACGLPAVSTNVGGAADYILPGQGGDLVAARDEQALAGAIEDWLNDR